MEALQNDFTIFFSNFGGVEFLKQGLMELMIFDLRERKFRIHFNF